MNFKQKREDAKLTQKQAAAAIGVDQSTICLWERGKTRPRAKLLVKIAQLYGCTVDDLLRETA